MTTTTKATIGSISHGTLRNEDLLEAFAAELNYLDRGNKLAGEALDALANDPDSEDAGWIIQELFDALNEYAPPFCYFGAHEGDPSDFGFWPDHEYIQRMIQEADAQLPDQAVNVSEGVRIDINDHGNVTIYSIWTHEVLLAIV